MEKVTVGMSEDVLADDIERAKNLIGQLNVIFNDLARAGFKIDAEISTLNVYTISGRRCDLVELRVEFFKRW